MLVLLLFGGCWQVSPPPTPARVRSLHHRSPAASPPCTGEVSVVGARFALGGKEMSQGLGLSIPGAVEERDRRVRASLHITSAQGSPLPSNNALLVLILAFFTHLVSESVPPRHLFIQQLSPHSLFLAVTPGSGTDNGLRGCSCSGLS